jgi:MoaA/NifB/PqqE/SkfB family radical SAM enzyme
MTSICPQLWDGCYINRRGEVYACCHVAPGSYGNIHDSTLRELVNSPAAVRARSESITGSLACFPSCNLLDKALTNSLRQQRSTVEYETLRRLHISFGEACNIRCVMCDHPTRHAKDPILLDPQVVIRNVDLAPFTTVMIQGGEPLFLSQCLEFMDYLEHIGKRYTLLTNGLLIDDGTAYRLAQHAKSVNVSLNGATKRAHESVNRGSRFERVVENVRRLRAARDALHSSMTLVGHMTITTSNVHEVPMFLRTFEALGFDRVNFGYVKETVPSYLASHPELTSMLRQETSVLLRGPSMRKVDTLRLRMLGIWSPDGAVHSVSERMDSSLLEMPMVR